MAQMTGGGRGMVRVIAGGCQQGVEASVVKTLEGVLVAVVSSVGRWVSGRYRGYSMLNEPISGGLHSLVREALSIFDHQVFRG